MLSDISQTQTLAAWCYSHVESKNIDLIDFGIRLGVTGMIDRYGRIGKF